MEENVTINDHSSFVTEENISFISNVSSVVVSNNDTLTVSSQKISGKPKSIVWGRYIKQGREISKGHFPCTFHTLSLHINIHGRNIQKCPLLL